MLAASNTSQAQFHREFLMARTQFRPQDFGVDISKEDFVELMVDEFNQHTQGGMSIDELLLHPREALHFCDLIRRKRNWFYMPDDIILRVIMQRRKNPAG